LNYGLLKSEPSVFGIDDLENCGRKGSAWDGVRNFQARNMLRDGMRKGDLAFLYHSSCDEPGITGIMEIASGGRPDPTAFDPEDHHYDPDSDPARPRWYLVDVRLKRRLRRLIPLQELRDHRPLSGMQLLQRGNRLSVMPVSKAHWDYILGLEKENRR
jgi:predicted RNA-binding protein with PUA-like domain